MPSISTQQQGAFGENLACDYLKKQGLTLKDRNFQVRQGEIDLIMQQGDAYVFVEVRYRDNEDYGGAIASITRSKQSKIITAAKLYLLQRELYDKVDCRFDVVILSNSPSGIKLDWIADAFRVN